MRIKTAEVADLKELAQLFDAYRVFYRKESDVEQAFSFLKERIEHNESVIYIAFNEASIMTGFTQLYPRFSSTRMKRLWLLNDLYVHPTYRGLGISKALIEQAKELVRETKACSLTLETEKSNIIGNKLYPATDFSLDEEHNYYYWDNQLI